MAGHTPFRLVELARQIEARKTSSTSWEPATMVRPDVQSAVAAVFAIDPAPRRIAVELPDGSVLEFRRKSPLLTSLNGRDPQ